mmetsp:Transcript_6495/g.14935  ORF Transcript_6495/g.14935 Transcript_6495/m.14935 type:complete len:223 (+) Transcript_6495:411-1079(+)
MAAFAGATACRTFSKTRARLGPRGSGASVHNVSCSAKSSRKTEPLTSSLPVPSPLVCASIPACAKHWKSSLEFCCETSTCAANESNISKLKQDKIGVSIGSGVETLLVRLSNSGLSNSESKASRRCKPVAFSFERDLAASLTSGHSAAILCQKSWSVMEQAADLRELSKLWEGPCSPSKMGISEFHTQRLSLDWSPLASKHLRASARVHPLASSLRRRSRQA